MYKITTKEADKCVTSKIELFRYALGFQKGKAIRKKVAFHVGLLEYVGILTKAQLSKRKALKR